MGAEAEMSPREVREELKGLLATFASFCERNSLRYFLAYGSLLGAVREGDMIEWDDDVDVLMPRPDYNQFLRLYERQPADGTSLMKPGDEGYPSSFAKVISTRTRFEATDHFFPENYGVYIDVFPIDGVPRVGSRIVYGSAARLRRVRHRLFPYLKPHLVQKPQTIRERAKKGVWHLFKAPRRLPAWLREQSEEALLATSALVLRGKSRATLASWAEKVVSVKEFEDAQVVADMVGWPTLTEATINRRHVDDFQWVQFGDLEVRGFAQPELLLEQWYGPGWRIPDPDYKRPHGRAFWKARPDAATPNEERDLGTVEG